jgi:iron complex outermembrane recepter protein
VRPGSFQTTRARDCTVKKTQFAKLKMGAAPLVLGVALISAPAFAQDADEDGAKEGEIVVTGTLIRNPNLEQSTPVNVTTSDAIELKQSNVAEEVLRELPGVVPNIGSAVNNGNGGASYVDLRGLGSVRNIVLLDGNRLAPSQLLGRVDLNNIPLALIERVDALTGAAVTTYGADAITGVVNFVTKRDFAGFELAASQQLTEQGDGHFFRVDATIGANFDDGRGNAVLSIGYQQSDPVYQGQRDFSNVQISSYSGGAAGSGTSVPSRFAGTRPLTAAGVPNTTPESIFTGARNPDGTPIYTANPGGASNGGLRQINAAGQGVGTFATFNFNPFNVFQVPFERFNVYGAANYEISDSVEVYTRGMFSKNTVSTIIAPSGSFGGTVNINLNNPYLPAALRNQFCAFDVNPRPDIYTPRFSAAECAAGATATGRADPNYREIGAGGALVAFDVNNDGVISAGEGYNPNPGVTLNRRTVEVGPRISEYQTTFFDYRIGFRGAVSDSIDWDIAASYGESENLETIKNYTLQSRFRNASLADNVTTCQGGQAGCVPVNLFGPEGSITPAMANYLSAESTSINRTSLAQVRGVLSGDFGFSLSGVENVAFAAGAEYRKYGASQAADLLAQTPGELGGAGGADPTIDGGYDVYEAYGELVIPVIQDKPFFEDLTLEAGARYSDYSIDGAGGYNTFTWKAGGSWTPTSGLKVRGNYSRAVRAPNIGELFTPQSVGLTNLGVDPCAGTAPTTNANLRAVCLAQGAPVGTIGSIANPTAAQANITTGGNLNLKPEKANTWTLGVVWQPDFLPRFSMSLDYYNIKVTEVLGTPLPGDIITACFGGLSAASATDPACTSIRRNPITGGLDGDPAITGGLFGLTNNLGRLFTDGVDLLMNYNTDLGFADLSLSFVGNWTRSSKYQADVAAGSLNRECVGYYSVNCSFTGSIQPELQFSQRTTLSFDTVDISLLWRWIDGVQFEPEQLAADIAAADGANRNAAGGLLTLPTTAAQIGATGFQGCPNFDGSNTGYALGEDPGGCVVEPGFRNIGAKHYFDLTGRWNINENVTFTVSVQNLLDSKPKLVGNTIGSTTFNSGNVFPSTYDALGRRYAASVKLKF